jgi:hypothetical protein
MLLIVHVFAMVKLGLGVAMMGLGVVMVWSNLKQVIVSLLTETLLRMRKSFYKLKNKHVMKSCLWNWSATKNFGSLGIEQICGHLKS